MIFWFEKQTLIFEMRLCQADFLRWKSYPFIANNGVNYPAFEVRVNLCLE